MMVNEVEQEFVRFHRANPHVYRLLVRITREMVEAGQVRVGIGDVYERVRYHIRTGTRQESGYYQPEGKKLKLANAHRAYYARLICQQEPDLKHVFVLAPLRTARVRGARPEPLKQQSLFETGRA